MRIRTLFYTTKLLCRILKNGISLGRTGAHSGHLTMTCCLPKLLRSRAVFMYMLTCTFCYHPIWRGKIWSGFVSSPCCFGSHLLCPLHFLVGLYLVDSSYYENSEHQLHSQENGRTPNPFSFHPASLEEAILQFRGRGFAV